jgi:hypothetical protein
MLSPTAPAAAAADRARRDESAAALQRIVRGRLARDEEATRRHLQVFHYDVGSNTHLNLRASPSTTAERVAKVAPGAELRVLKTSGDWLRVKLKDDPEQGDGPNSPSREMWALRRVTRNDGSVREMLSPTAPAAAAADRARRDESAAALQRIMRGRLARDATNAPFPRAYRAASTALPARSLSFSA